jgi:hypothetical protein
MRPTKLSAKLRFSAFAAVIVCSTGHADDAARAATEEWIRTLDPLTAGGWELLTWNTGGAIYVSYRNAQRDGAVATVWIRWEYLSPHQFKGVSYKSSAERTQFDCVQMTARALTQSFYERNSLAGDSQSFAYDKPMWAPGVPGTLLEALGATVCNRTAPHAPKTKSPG